jgi:hypothetical protein
MLVIHAVIVTKRSRAESAPSILALAFSLTRPGAGFATMIDPRLTTDIVDLRCAIALLALAAMANQRPVSPVADWDAWVVDASDS